MKLVIALLYTAPNVEVKPQRQAGSNISKLAIQGNLVDHRNSAPEMRYCKNHSPPQGI